jgi:hypothetical protein
MKRTTLFTCMRKARFPDSVGLGPGHGPPVLTPLAQAAKQRCLLTDQWTVSV